MIVRNKIQPLEYGDYQTPLPFAREVCEYLKNHLKINPEYIFEPTFGMGAFLESSIKTFNKVKKAFGVEINEEYSRYTRNRLKSFKGETQISLYNENIFDFDFRNIKDEIARESEILIIGNPPWVTNSELGSIGSANLPTKTNFKRVKGFDALTGKSNFDIAEYIISRLLSEFEEYNCYLSMLCKNTVAKNIVRDIESFNFKLSDIRLLTFNAMEVFNVSCDAGLLVIKVDGRKKEKKICDVYELKNPRKKIRSFGWWENKFISALDNYFENDVDGKCPFEWRQGVKHDCSRVMELTYNSEKMSFFNGLKESVDVEEQCIYPLLKSSDLKEYRINDTRKYVIITQKKIKQETESLRYDFPKLWKYLLENASYLDKRKSTIYKKAPRFSIFGIGLYSFKKYKVAVSGFYKEPRFSLVYADKEIMLDDTCYFIGFDDYKSALISMLLLNHSVVKKFIKSIAFLDSKRPFTKEVLMRIDLNKVTEIISLSDLLKSALENKIEVDINEEDYKKYKQSIKSNDLLLFR